MHTAIILLNFGEPENATREEVIPFLERIFTINSRLMGDASLEEVRERSHLLAEERAPGLIAEYEEIGGSPLLQQANDQAEALQGELRQRGKQTDVFVGMQFTPPSIADAAQKARDAGAQRIVALPVYPLAGPSTTVAALNELDRVLHDMEWDVPVERITGWHLHPAYLRLRVDAIRAVLVENGLTFDDRTKLVFSAHGTPVLYLEEGNRYDLYVRDFCERVAEDLGVSEYRIGYQNHGNRPGVKWTQPDIESLIGEIDADTVVVDPISFMHEQSETLAELDVDLREDAEGRGLNFFRVPIEHVAPEFISVLADLAEPFTDEDEPVGTVMVAGLPYQQCQCADGPGTHCFNPVLFETTE